MMQGLQNFSKSVGTFFSQFSTPANTPVLDAAGNKTNPLGRNIDNLLRGFIPGSLPQAPNIDFSTNPTGGQVIPVSQGVPTPAPRKKGLVDDPRILAAAKRKKAPDPERLDTLLENVRKTLG